MTNTFIKTINDLNNNPIAPTTVPRAIKINELGDNLEDELCLNINSKIKPNYNNKYFTFCIDNVTSDILDRIIKFKELGVRPTINFYKAQIENGQINWDIIKRLQNSGYEISYHWGASGANDAGVESDIDEFLNLCKKYKIKCYGYAGNGNYPCPQSRYNRFLWYRPSPSIANRPDKTKKCFGGVDGKFFLETYTKEEILADFTGEFACFNVHQGIINSNFQDVVDLIESIQALGYEFKTPLEMFEYYTCKYGGWDSDDSIYTILNGTATKEYHILSENGKLIENIPTE